MHTKVDQALKHQIEIKIEIHTKAQDWALNNKIKRLHEGCLCIIYKDKTSTFKELLEVSKQASK